MLRSGHSANRSVIIVIVHRRFPSPIWGMQASNASAYVRNMFPAATDFFFRSGAHSPPRTH